jgi:hypothetical protein
VDILDDGGVGENYHKGEADASDIINTCLCQLKVSDAGTLLTVESQCKPQQSAM